MREYFCDHHNMLAGTRKRSDAECGRLLRALLQYSAGADVEQIKLQGREEVLFDAYAVVIDADHKRHELEQMDNALRDEQIRNMQMIIERLEEELQPLRAAEQNRLDQLRQNGSRGGRPKKTNGFENGENKTNGFEKKPMVFEEEREKEEKENEKEEKEKRTKKEREEREREKEEKEREEPAVCACAHEAPPGADTLEAYATSNLQYMSYSHMQELASFKADMPEELIRHAIDEACAAGKRVWAYTRSILNRYLESGFRTLGDVKAAEEKRRSASGSKQQQSSPVNFKQREYTEGDSKNCYFDLEKFFAEEGTT